MADGVVEAHGKVADHLGPRSVPPGVRTRSTSQGSIVLALIHLFEELRLDARLHLRRMHPPPLPPPKLTAQPERQTEEQLTRHEEEAAFAAAGEAALTGELAVSAGSCAPGNMHLINGSATRTAAGFPCSRSPRTSRATRSAANTSRKASPTELFRDCTVF